MSKTEKSNRRLYLIVTRSISDMGGAQIYVRNKVKYMRSIGWDVGVVTYYRSNIILNDIAECNINIPALEIYPTQVSRAVRKKAINDIIERFSCDDRCVIEAHSFSAALWAELLAEKIKGKSFCFFLHEGERLVDESFFRFLRFKLQRDEIAGINKMALQQIKCRGEALTSSTELVLRAACGNSVEDVPIPNEGWLCSEKAFKIAVIGRVEKSYVEKSVKEIIKYSEEKGVNIELLLVGGTRAEGLVEKYIGMSDQRVNIQCTGYIYPIPLKLLQRAELAIAGSGAVKGPAENKVLTLSMDTNGDPIGVYGIDTFKTQTPEESNRRSLSYYLDRVRESKYSVSDIKTDGVVDEEQIRLHFSKHMERIEQSSSEKQYYDVSKVYNGFIRTILCRSLGVSGYRNIVSRIKG